MDTLSGCREFVALNAALAEIGRPRDEALDSAILPIRCPNCGTTLADRGREVSCFRTTRVSCLADGLYLGRLVVRGGTEAAVEDGPGLKEWSAACPDCRSEFPVGDGSAVDRRVVKKCVEADWLWSTLKDRGYFQHLVRAGVLEFGTVAFFDDNPDEPCLRVIAGPPVETGDVDFVDYPTRRILAWGPDRAFVTGPAASVTVRLDRRNRIRVLIPDLPPDAVDPDVVDMIKGWDVQKPIVRGWVLDYLRSKFPDDAVAGFASALGKGEAVWFLLTRGDAGGDRAGLDL